jgi:Family of unknown function (DUF6370)
MKLLTSLLFGSLFVVSLAARVEAADSKPEAAKVSTKSTKPGKEVTLNGTFGCAKCSFKEASACQNVLKVKKGDKDVTYELAQNALAKEHHDDICHNAGKPATIKGIVSEDGGKKILTASEIKLN